MVWGVYLTTLSIWDIRTKTVPLPLLLAGGIPALWQMAEGVRSTGMNALVAALLGTLPGVLLLFLAWSTGKVGYGDGILMAELGTTLSVTGALAVLCLASLCSALFCIGGLAVKRLTKKSTIPFLPFLAAGYGLSLLILR
jgi:prepilin signal peptidase PulO-like enzyme (type II secretory pathway)